MIFSKELIRAKLTSFSKKGRFHALLVEFLLSDLCWILIVGGLFRLFYYSLLDDHVINDTSYLDDTSNIFEGRVNPGRTPVYPYFIRFIKLFGKQNLIHHIVIAQCVLSFLFIIVFYKTISNVFKSKKVIIAATLLYIAMLPVVNFDTVIFTETLSICCIVALVNFIVSYLKKQTIGKSIALTLFVFFCIMLRPSFIILLPIIIIFWILRFAVYKKERSICLIGLSASFVVVLLIHSYSILNKKTNGFYGISTIQNLNQLDILIYADMYNKGNDAELTATLNNTFNKPLTPRQHWDSVEKILASYPPERISTFIHTCIKNQPFAYLKRIARTAMALQTENMFTNWAKKKEGKLPRLMFDIQFFIFYTTFNKLFLFLFLDFIFLVISYYKLKQIDWLHVILWMIITAQLLISIVAAQDEYQRLILAAIPCLIILIFSYIDRIYYAIDKNKLTFKNF